MSPVLISFSRPSREERDERFPAEMKSVLRAFEAIDPRLMHMCKHGSQRKGRKPPPDSLDVPDEKYAAAALKKGSWILSHQSRSIYPDSMSMSFSVGNFDSRFPSQLRLDAGDNFYHEPKTMRAILQVGIEAWQAGNAFVIYIGLDGGLDIPQWLYWLYWERDRVDPAHLAFIAPGKATAPIIAPWLGGTLYTWPQNAPWLLLEADNNPHSAKVRPNYPNIVDEA